MKVIGKEEITVDSAFAQEIFSISFSDSVVWGIGNGKRSYRKIDTPLE